jgi:hypothetical protein
MHPEGGGEVIEIWISHDRLELPLRDLQVIAFFAGEVVVIGLPRPGRKWI